MKNGIHLLWASLLIGTMTVSANPIDVAQAQSIAKKFCAEAVVKNKMRKAPANAKMKLVYKSHGKKADNNLLYAFDRGTANGFVVVAGDDRAPQILGYTDTGSFDISNMPENMRWWIQQYEQQMRYLQDNPKARLTTPKRNVNVVAPLLGEIEWNQESPYNANCPYMSYYDEDEEETVSGKAPTGCVATALAQVMRYHKWPNESKGNISYTTYTLKQNITADLNATYNWDLMLPTYTGVTATDEQKAEVAKLMYNVGAALQSDYTPSGTGATDVDVVPTLVRYFNYDPGARYVQRDYTAVNLYEQGLINEIEAGRPVPYGGVTKKNDGHFFVLDGINEDGYYHINWGWGGLSNGYFLISSLDPDAQGVGGSTSTYTAFKYHQLYISGLQKPQEGSKTGWNIMANDISKINDTYAKGDEINTTIYDAYNNSCSYDTLKCKLYWDIYDSEGTIIEKNFIKNDTLALNYGFDKLTTNFKIPADIADGEYTVKLDFTQAEDDYTEIHNVAMKAGANKYYKINVEGDEVNVSTAAGLKLSIESVTPERLKAGETSDLKVTFKNTGEDYVGDFNFFLYVNGKKNVYPNYTSPQRIVSIPANSTVTLDFKENIPSKLVTDDDYVLQFYYYTTDEDGYTDKNNAAKTKIGVDGAAKPAALYILDDIQAVNETDSKVPMNDIQLGVNFENEGAEYNAPIIVKATSDDDWSFEDSFTTDTINVPADCNSKYVILKGALTNVEEGKTYELCIYTNDNEFIDPSYCNGVDVTIASNTTAINMTIVGKGIILSNNTVSAADASQIALFDINGSLINKVNGNKLSIENVRKGCYLIRVNGENGTEVKKIIVK
ncbi:C10 family peptidase [Prevotella pectinovora]|uniref:C10 family peptidase n=1 Tax=Prevotella pectinovora TaxID=1602169 RepID=UPI00069674D9|nr:C10 family peptidase [Prevotella pectinovora]